MHTDCYIINLHIHAAMFQLTVRHHLIQLWAEDGVQVLILPHSMATPTPSRLVGGQRGVVRHGADVKAS